MMARTGPTRRPRFQFSLRTLLVLVTVVGLALAWQQRVNRERTELLRELRERGAVASDHPALGYEFQRGVRSRIASGLWISPERVIFLPEDKFTDNDVQRAERLFPEAHVVFGGAANASAILLAVEWMNQHPQVSAKPAP